MIQFCKLSEASLLHTLLQVSLILQGLVSYSGHVLGVAMAKVHVSKLTVQAYFKLLPMSFLLISLGQSKLQGQAQHQWSRKVYFSTVVGQGVNIFEY